MGGATAELVDELASLGATLPWMALMVAVTTFVLLFLAFGSVVLPVKAIVMNVASLTATFGVIVWIFQEGHLSGLLHFTPTGTIDPTMPILMLAIIFGLSMDYEVFLLSRIRERYDVTGDNTAAVAGGLQRTGGIITSLALLLVIVVGAFSASGITFIKLMGVGMIIALVVDATIIRVLLVPATMRLLGPVTWWAPRPLRRFYARYGIREDSGDAGQPRALPARKVQSRCRCRAGFPVPGGPVRRPAPGIALRRRRGGRDDVRMTWTAPEVDRPEPPLVAGERESLDAWLDFHRDTLLGKCSGLTADQLRERAVPPSGLSLLGLVRHMTDVERWWFRVHGTNQDMTVPLLHRRQPGWRLRRPGRAGRPGRPGGILGGGRPGPGGVRDLDLDHVVPSHGRPPGTGAEHPLDLRAHDRGVRPPQRPRRPAPRAHRRRDGRLAARARDALAPPRAPPPPRCRRTAPSVR